MVSFLMALLNLCIIDDKFHGLVSWKEDNNIFDYSNFGLYGLRRICHQWVSWMCLNSSGK